MGDDCMKKFIIALVLLISCSGFVPAYAVNWEWAATSLNGEKWYVDTSSIKKGNTRTLLWVKRIYPTGNYQLSQIGITKSREAIEFQYINYNSMGEVVSYYIYEPWECKAIAVPPDTILDVIYHLIW